MTSGRSYFNADVDVSLLSNSRGSNDTIIFLCESSYMFQSISQGHSPIG